MSSLYNGWASGLVPVCEVTERLLRDEEMRRAGPDTHWTHCTMGK